MYTEAYNTILLYYMSLMYISYPGLRNTVRAVSQTQEEITNESINEEYSSFLSPNDPNDLY